jgi:hypothetical protein
VADETVPFSELLAGYGTTTIGEDEIESVFSLLKIRAEDGAAAWSVRSGGIPLRSEELLGVLDGLISSIRLRLTKSWKPRVNPERPPLSAPAAEHVPIQFSDLFAGLRTVRIGDGYLIESIFAVIKARRSDGVPIWHVRSAEMKLSSEELLGALEGYAATLREELSSSWNW